MKIVGGHDYWDSAAAYGVDETVTLVRTTNMSHPTFTTNDFFFPSIRFYDVNNRTVKLEIGAIMVAGSVYPFAYDNICMIDPHTRLHSYKTHIMYDVNEIVKKYPNIKEKAWYDGTDEEKYLWFCNQPAFQEKAVVDFLCEHNAAFALIMPEQYSNGGWNWFKTSEPIHKQSNVWINPSNLKDWDFFKVKDSYTMFMEVDQWVTGVLPQNKETVVLSDKSKIVKAGFDVKHSFRKGPEK